MAEHVTQIMERASIALSRMNYLECEVDCLEALAAARAAEDWANYGRILMPLQECRRQRRMIAADGDVRLGTSDLPGTPEQWLADHRRACIAITGPHQRGDAEQLNKIAASRRLFIEILWIDGDSSTDTWQVCSFSGPNVSIVVPAPLIEWREKWLVNDPLTSARSLGKSSVISAESGTQSESSSQSVASIDIHATPADWFLNIGEALGDAALEQVRAPLGTRERVAELESCLAVVTDHEILHQALGDAARAMLR